MAIPADIKKTLTDTTPLYAVAGVGDLAVAKLRRAPARLQEQAAYALTSVARAGDVYGELTGRGKDVVRRIKRQKASQDLQQQAARTTRRAKAARTSTRKTASAAGKAAGAGSAKVGTKA